MELTWKRICTLPIQLAEIFSWFVVLEHKIRVWLIRVFQRVTCCHPDSLDLFLTLRLKTWFVFVLIYVDLNKWNCSSDSSLRDPEDHSVDFWMERGLCISALISHSSLAFLVKVKIVCLTKRGSCVNQDLLWQIQHITQAPKNRPALKNRNYSFNRIRGLDRGWMFEWSLAHKTEMFWLFSFVYWNLITRNKYPRCIR